MRILIDINHPGHVHFFKNIIWDLEKKGCNFLLTARDKEVTLDLLNAYGFDYINRGRGYTNVLGRLRGIAEIDFRLWRIYKKYKPTLTLCIGSPYPAQVSWFMGIPHITFTDTSHATFLNALTFPFSDIICTPSCFFNELGRKQIRYNGYQELAYLHPKYFREDMSVLNEVGLPKGDKYVILRFVALQASHDLHSQGGATVNDVEMVKALSRYARVIITSEIPLKPELEKYRYNAPPHKIHTLLKYASLYMGDGETMAVESAILGTPSIETEIVKLSGNRVADTTSIHGPVDELVNKYDLMFAFSDPKKSLDKAIEILKDDSSKKEWIKKSERLINDKVDVTEFAIKLVENHREHIENIRGI